MFVFVHTPYLLSFIDIRLKSASYFFDPPCSLKEDDISRRKLNWDAMQFSSLLRSQNNKLRGCYVHTPTVLEISCGGQFNKYLSHFFSQLYILKIIRIGWFLTDLSKTNIGRFTHSV